MLQYMKQTYLLIGGNLGKREEKLDQARRSIATTVGKIISTSSIYETAAWGKEDQPAFLNQVLLVETALSPSILMQKLLAIEQDMGRERDQKYGPRSIDIDIL